MKPAYRIHRAITIYSAIAWRLLLLTLMGREVPQMSAEVLFTDTQLFALQDLAQEHERPPPTDLASAVLLVALLGGYQPGKKRPPPGMEVMWEGYQRLELIALGGQLRMKYQM